MFQWIQLSKKEKTILTKKFNQINNKIPRMMIFGKGTETERLKKLPHFGHDYENTEIYQLLGKPDKKTINRLGIMYNRNFQLDILQKKYPKYGRDQKRNKAIAIWFFEDNKQIIIPWLQSIKLIS